jgi:hypothetical protein
MSSVQQPAYSPRRHAKLEHTVDDLMRMDAANRPSSPKFDELLTQLEKVLKREKPANKGCGMCELLLQIEFSTIHSLECVCLTAGGGQVNVRCGTCRPVRD